MHLAVVLQLLMFGGLCTAVWVGLWGGLVGLLQALLVFYAGLLLVYYLLIIKPLLNIGLPEIVRWTLPECLLAFVSFELAHGLFELFTPSWYSVAGYGVLGMALYGVGLLWVVRPGLREEVRMIFKRGAV
jgi:hypothetical protein